MQTITPIQLDIQQPEYIVVVHAMQQDEKTRYIAISMTEAGVAFTPPSGTLGVLAIRKPDGETCFYDSSNGEPAVTIDGSTATCLLVPEALQVAGDATAALVLYNAQGERLSTFRFLLRIDPTPVLDETVMSSSYYSILTQQIAQALIAAEVAQQVLDMTVSAETLAAGSQATVTKTMSGGVVNLAFGIPQGIQGVQGPQGEQGEQGPQGVPGLTIDVLWENASPGSSFSAQTISLPSISGYNVFFVVTQWSTTNADYQVTGMAYLPVGSSGEAVIPLVYVNGVSTTASSLFVYTRYVTIQRPGSIVFDDAYRGHPTDAAVGNQYLIPLYIIGATI